jgi:acyl carrier protein
MNKDILPKIYKSISLHTGIDPTEISPDDDFEDDLNISDMELAEIISQIEDDFGVEIEIEDAKKVRTVADLAILVEEAGYI